jgi:hypothetical protein
MTARLVFPKTLTFRSGNLRRAVASLPCVCCGRVGAIQAAHTNTGKGGGIKASDAAIMALCADSPGFVGCHSRVDARSTMTKVERRVFELEMVALTYIALMERGLLTVAQ